jgi:hypothetical protein
MISVLAVLGFFQIQVSAFPVLDFPEAGLDDTASYQGYQTRFYRDSDLPRAAVQPHREPVGERSQ